MKKFWKRSIPGILIVIWLILLYFTPLFSDSDDYFGLRKINIDQNTTGSLTISIKCLDYSGYKITTVDHDEKAYKGEQLLPINNDLGEFVVKVVLKDTDTAKCFRENFAPWTTYRLDDSNITFMYTYSPDHGISIYIGSDEPINCDQIRIRGF